LLLFNYYYELKTIPIEHRKKKGRINQKRKMKENQTKTKTKRFTVFSYNTNELKNFF